MFSVFQTVFHPTMNSSSKPLIAHVLYRFDVGGLENGVVNLLNHPALSGFRHAVIALTEVTDFAQRIHNPDVSFHALHKLTGHGVQVYPAFIRLLRTLKPQLIHTRNLAALEMALPAWLAGVPYRLHSEHGRDMSDLDGRNKKYQWLRRCYRPWVHRYIALSQDLESYLHHQVGIPSTHISQIYNGVDTQRFAPSRERVALRARVLPQHWFTHGSTPENAVVFGTIGRMEHVKNQRYLAQAFIQTVQQPGTEHARLMLVGGGNQREEIRQLLNNAGLSERVWLPGNRNDVAELLGCMDVFALPSLAEGISNTILEAMACGVPVIATDVGGNPELVHADTGRLVPLHAPEKFAQILVHYAQQPQLRSAQGQAARQRATQEFSLDGMAQRYAQLYQHGIKQ